MKFKKDNALVGLFVIIGFLISMGVLFFVLGYDFNENRITYTFRFIQLSGIKKGSEVLLKGHVVGEVKSITPIYGSNIYFKALVAIDKGLQLYRGTKSVVTNKNVIGDAALVLEIPKMKENILHPGHTIFANNTRNLDELINQMSKLTTNLNHLVASLGDLAGSNKTGVNRIIFTVNDILNKLNRITTNSEESIMHTLVNISKTTRTLRRFAAEVRRNPLLLLQGKNKK